MSYTPSVPGKYYVTVKYNGKNVAGSPFSVNVGGENLSGEATSSTDHRKDRERRSSRCAIHFPKLLLRE